jgi:hypothetical protein
VFLTARVPKDIADLILNLKEWTKEKHPKGIREELCDFYLRYKLIFDS